MKKLLLRSWPVVLLASLVVFYFPSPASQKAVRADAGEHRGAHPVEPAPATPNTLSPSLAGEPAIASSLPVRAQLQPAWGTGAIPGPEQGEGAFRFDCTPSHLSYDDPVIYPGQPGRSHLHTFVGNTRADAFSTYRSLRTSGESTCNNLLNRSAYWVPTMMNGRGQAIMPQSVMIYYKGLPSRDPLCQKIGRACITIPRGLRYVFGFNMQDPKNSAPAESMWWHCDAPNVGGHLPNIAQAARNCPNGARLGMVLTGPNCWNGKELDSADHRSHMAFTRYVNGVGKCPPTHPYVIPHFTIGAWYITDETLDRSGDESPDARTWYLSSDRMPGMADAVPGTTMHSDWFGAWEDSVLDTWQANCIEKMLSCSGGDLGNGQQLRVAPAAKLPRLVAIPPRPRA